LVASVTTFAFNRGLLRALGADALLQPWQWEAITNALSRRDPEGRDFGRPADILVPKGMLKLVYTSREFQIGGASLDRTHLFIGPMLNPPAASPADGQRRLIYASLGTWSNRHATFFETCLACFSDGTRPVLISLGDGLRPEQFGQIPPNLRLASFVEQTSVLGATGLFITHGGMNSVSEALIYGVPMILVPQDADQLLVAKRVEQLGAGLVIGKDEFSPEALARCVEHIDRHRDGFVTRSRRLGRGFASASEQSAMLDRILALAGRPETHTVATGSSNDG
jgi:MGT family glycosyltransferase